MKVTIYSKEKCTYCSKAKAMLNSLGIEYTEKKLEEFKTVDDMFKDIGKQVRTMPQIKIDNELIGGYHQLVEHLDDKGLVNYKGEKVEQR
tara:strand:- start:801 stop:1070 length:270 start_codon:yes stop_codon:yes gene_type:complete